MRRLERHRRREVPFWARGRYFPPRRAALIADWDAKIARLAPLSLGADIRSISGTPSWLLIFFDALAALKPDAPQRLASWYPDLELLVHGGLSFAPYRRRFEALLEGSHAELREVYPASEGFVAVADRGPDDGLRLILDNGLFYRIRAGRRAGRAEPDPPLDRHRRARGRIRPRAVELRRAVGLCAGRHGAPRRAASRRACWSPAARATPSPPSASI